MSSKRCVCIRYIICAFMALIVAFIAEYSFNIDLECMDIITNSGSASQEFILSDAELINCYSEEGVIYSQNQDPEMIFRNVDSYVDCIEIECCDLSYSTLPLQIFYTGDETTFDDDRCISSIIRCDRRVIYLELDEYVHDLRIDIGMTEDSYYRFESAVINPTVGDYLTSVFKNMSMVRMLIFFLISLTAVLALDDFARFKRCLHKYRWLIGGAVIVITTLLRLHGSSLGQLAEIMQGADTDLLIGSNRFVRSDEYVVFTEMAASQVKSGFGWFSDIWGYSPSDMFIIYGQPVLNLMTVFRPFSVGYIFLGLEMGLSFYWISRIVVGLLVSYEFGRLLTKDDRGLSFAYSVLVIFAPVVQWWFSTNELIETIVAGQCALLIVHKYIRTKKLLHKVLLSFGFAYCGGVYILAFYPAWMIPLAYVFLACFVAIIFENRKDIRIRLSDFIIWAGTLGLFLICFAYIYSKSGDTIKAILSTSYPGKRTYDGGPVINIVELFRSWTGYIWSFADTENACEEVCFMSFFPMGIVLSCIALFRKKIKDHWLISLGIANVLLITYSVIPMPGIAGTLTLLNKSLDTRIIIIVGFLNLMILIRALYVLRTQDLNKYLIAFTVIAVISCIISFVANDEKQPVAIIVLTIILAALPAYLICNINKPSVKKVFVAYCVCVSAVGGLMVNPVSRGIDSVISEPQIQEISRIDEADEGLWMTVGSHMLSNVPAMMGGHTASALDTYPDESLWNVTGLGSEKDIWNRYAHKVIEIGDETSLVLEKDDLVTLYLTVEDLRKLGVNYLFSIEDLSEYEDLELIYSYSYFDIYRVD